MNGKSVYTSASVPRVPKQPRPPKVMKSYRVDARLFEKVQEKCDREGVNVTDVIVEAFEAFVEDE